MDHSQDKKLNNVESDVQDLKSARKAEQVRRRMEEEELIHLNHLRVQIVEEIDALVFVLKQRKKTVRDITEAIYAFLVKEEMQLKKAHHTVCVSLKAERCTTVI